MSHFEKSCKKFSGPVSTRSVLIRNKRPLKEPKNKINIGYNNERKVYINSTPNHLNYDDNNLYSVHYDYSNGTMVSPVGWS